MQDRSATNARRFEIYVRWSLYVLMSLLPIQVAALIVGATTDVDATTDDPALPVSLVTFALSVAVTAFNAVAVRRSLDAMMRSQWRPRHWFMVGWGSSIVALTTATFFLGSVPAAFVSGLLAVACAVAAVSPVLSARQTIVVSVVGALLIGSAAAFLGLGPAPALVASAALLTFLWSAWASGWMVGVLRQLQKAHETQAQLTVAEERLRISRDLHDVFGRTLATISVKSELAAELSRRGHHERAADEMAQVRHVANSAGAEVRRVIRGESRARWTDEVDGARALLTSAGIRCVIAGEEVPIEHAETLAWVIREGITNVLRHSRATQVSITTAVEDDEVALTLTNDGATGPSTADSGGTGLVSMADRLHAVGGSLNHERDGEWFLLTASIPAPRRSPHDPSPARR